MGADLGEKNQNISIGYKNIPMLPPAVSLKILHHIVRCCIYLTTYDWIKSFLKITIEGRLICFTGRWEIPFLTIMIETDCSTV